MSTNESLITPENHIDLAEQGALLLDVTQRYEELRDAVLDAFDDEQPTKEAYLGAVAANEGDDDLLDPSDLAEIKFDEAALEIFNDIVKKDEIEILKKFRLGEIDEGDMRMSDLMLAGTHGSYLDNVSYAFKAPEGQLVVEKVRHIGTTRIPEKDITTEDYRIAVAAIATLDQVTQQLATSP